MKIELRLRTLISAILTLSFLTSCATTIQPVRSPIDLPTRFSLEGDVPLPDRWWEHLGDPALNRLVEKSLSDNFSLLAAWDRLSQAEARLKAAGADLWPALDASGSGRYSWRTQETGNSGLDYSDSWNRSLSLAADYEVDLWGRIRSRQNAEALQTMSSEEDVRTAAITLSAQVALAWYQIQEQAGQLALLEDQIETIETTLELIESRFRQGQANASDVLQQRQLVESRREELQRALSRLRVQEIVLTILLGEAPGIGPFEAEGKLIELPPLPQVGLPGEVVTRRPDVRSAYLQVQAADQALAAAIADRYPSLRLTAGYSTEGEQWRDLFNNWLATIGANLVAPIIDGGARRAEVERNRAIVMERFHDYGQTTLEALGEVEQALIREQQQHATLESIERQLSLARQVLERIQVQYLSGAESYLRILDAQLSVLNLERERLTARRELIDYRIDLCRAAAGGWQLERPVLKESPDVTEQSEYPLPL